MAVSVVPLTVGVYGAAERSCPYDDPALVRRFTPEFIKRWNRFGRPAGRSWRVDETYIKVRGELTYLYRAVDKAGHTVDFRLSRTRDVAAAKAFFKKAIRHEGRPPHTITIEGYAASHRAVREMREGGPLSRGTKLRSSRHLNNLIEQDHRGIKSRNPSHVGLQELRIRHITIAGLELLRRIRKDQFALGTLRLKGQTLSALWTAVLAARRKHLKWLPLNFVAVCTRAIQRCLARDEVFFRKTFRPCDIDSGRH